MPLELQRGGEGVNANPFITSVSEGSVWAVPLADGFNPEKYPVPILE